MKPLSNSPLAANLSSLANELKFAASGELDNGFTWDYFMELDPDGTAEGGSALNDDTSFAVTTPYGVVKACASECGLGAHGAFSQNAYAWITDTAVSVIHA